MANYPGLGLNLAFQQVLYEVAMPKGVTLLIRTAQTCLLSFNSALVRLHLMLLADNKTQQLSFLAYMNVGRQLK